MRHNEFIKCPCILIQTQVNQNFVSCCSFANSCLNLHDSVDCSTAGFPVLPYLSEFAQTHVHWVDDAIQPSYPLLPPSPPVLSPSQHQGLLFQWVNPSHQVAKVLELQIQHQSFQWISSVQSLSHVQLFVTPWTAGCQASLSVTNSWSLLKLMSIALVMPSKHLIPWIFNEYSVLISFRVDWFDGLLSKGLQYHRLEASIIQSSAFFMVQFSHPYMTTGKIISLTTQTFAKLWLCFLIHCLGLL